MTEFKIKFNMKKISFVILLLLQVQLLLSQEKFKIVSYNVLEGLQQDSVNKARFVDWIDSIDPDIVAFQEMNKFTQKNLEEFAKRYGHPYAIQSKLEGFPVAISSKYPIVNVQKVVDNMWHAYIYTNIRNLHIFVIHFSPFEYKKRQSEIKTILTHAALLPQDEPILIMGDFNSLDRSDDSNYDEQMVKGMRKRELEQSHIRNLNNGNIDYSVMDHLTKAGYKDTHWLTNKKFKHSVPTKKSGSSNFRRIDFIWVNPILAKKIVKSDIIHDEKTDVMSDHYPIYIEIDMSKK